MSEATIRRVLVVGAGGSGQQIALQFARFGFEAAVYDIDAHALERGRRRIGELLARLTGDLLIAPSEAASVVDRISYWRDPAQAAENVDLLCEATPEDLELKRRVLQQFDALCKPAAVFTTNTSYLLPSSMAHASGRPAQFAAFHFHVPVWYANAVDVMPHRLTSAETVDVLCRIARQIDQTPIVVRRENPGYVFNSLLHPLLLSALDLAAREVVGFQDVDRAWMAVTKMAIGPFGMLDKIGLDTVRQILKQWGKWLGQPQSRRAVELLQDYVDRRRLGEKSSCGFYDYPHPAYAAPNFLGGAAGSVTASGRQRLAPVHVPEPYPPRVKHTFRSQGRAVIWGDDDTASELEARLTGVVSGVERAPADLAVGDAAGWLTDAWQAAPIPHLFLVASGDAAAVREVRRRADAVELPFMLCQAWFRLIEKEGLFDKASLLAICRMDGAAGSSEQTPALASGALTGLAKAISMESMSRNGIGICVKAVDFELNASPAQCVEKSLAEIAMAQASIVNGSLSECRQRQSQVEVGYHDQSRMVVRYRRAPISGRTKGAREPHGCWLVSGGAGGIVLPSALALAQRFGLELHLIGRTPLPERDFLAMSASQIEGLKADVMRAAYRRKQKPNLAWQKYDKQMQVQRALDALRHAQIPAAYHQADIADVESVRRIVASIQATGRSISGILHGAGVERTCRFESKTREGFWETVRPKWLGTQALFDATGASLEWFVAFSSLAGRFGGVGQVDYVMANAMQAQLMAELGRRRRQCRFLTIDWPGWDDAGMAVRSESRFLFEYASHRLMPLSAGVRHFVEEFAEEPSIAEAIIADPEELGAEFLALTAEKCKDGNR